MIIQLGERDRIRRYDKLNLVIETLEQRKNKDGEEVLKWIIKGYYSRLSTALSALPDHLIMGDAITLKEFFQRWQSVIDDMTKKI